MKLETLKKANEIQKKLEHSFAMTKNLNDGIKKLAEIDNVPGTFNFQVTKNAGGVPCELVNLYMIKVDGKDVHNFLYSLLTAMSREEIALKDEFAKL